MTFQDRQYRIEHCKGDSEKVLERHVFWSSKPSRTYFEGLARLHLAGFWRRDGRNLRPVRTPAPVPDLVIVRDHEGHEMCRWSVADELANLRGIPSSMPAFVAALALAPTADPQPGHA